MFVILFFWYTIVFYCVFLKTLLKVEDVVDDLSHDHEAWVEGAADDTTKRMML